MAGGGPQTDGRKHAGGGQIAGTKQHPGVNINPGRCGVGWCGLKQGKRRGWGSGRQGRLKIRRTRSGGEGLGGVKKVT